MNKDGVIFGLIENGKVKTFFPFFGVHYTDDEICLATVIILYYDRDPISA
jgi:hypothetical protein